MDPSASPDPPPVRPSSRFIRRLVAGVVLLNLLVAAIAFLALARSRAHFEERSVVTAQNLSRVLDESLTGIFAKVDVALLAVVDEAQRQLSSGAVQPAALDAFIVREHGRVAELETLRATDAAGDARYGAPARAATTSSLAHRDYYKLLAGTPGAGLVISRPLVGGISGKWMVVLARRINRPDGAFAGLVYAGLTLDYLTRAFSRIDIGRHGSIALTDAEATLVARYPEVPSGRRGVGERIDSPPFEALLRGSAPEGTYVHRSSVDGIEKTFAARRLGLPRPFYVLVGLASHDALEKWRADAWQLLGFLATFLLLSSGATLVLARVWRRTEQEVAQRQQAQAQLTRRNEELEATLARTKRLEGILSICMHCKKINSRQASWQQLEKYISDHSDARFSHGICPDCLSENYPGVDPAGVE